MVEEVNELCVLLPNQPTEATGRPRTGKFDALTLPSSGHSSGNPHFHDGDAAQENQAFRVTKL